MVTKDNQKPIYILDTNVLLYNPRAIYAFPEAEVVIPDTVLAELDKIKVSRMDKDLRYRSREISRILFDLSEFGKLTEGIPFGQNSLVRVVVFDPEKPLVDFLNSRSSDDRILAVAYQLKKEAKGRKVAIVTNDLNMLLKAQTLDIPVENPGPEFAYGAFRRFLVKLKSQKSLIFSAAIIVLAILSFVFWPQILDRLGLKEGQTPAAPAKIMEQLQEFQTKEYAYLSILDRNPKDLQALIGLGNLYYDQGEIYQDPKYRQKAIEYYEKALRIDPGNNDVRTDMAVEYYRLGVVDIAIRELEKVLTRDPKHINAHFNLGFILMQSKNDLKGARKHFKECVKLAPARSEVAIRAKGYLYNIDRALSQQ
jgi:tetratricopeptide (TPR) repeat protein